MRVNKFSLAWACLIFSLTATAQWNDDPAINNPVCITTTSNQFKPQLAPDGSGGFFVTWMEADLAFSSGSIYAQHLSATGSPLWAVGGISINGSFGLFSDPQIVADGNGNAIISWILNENGTIRHYVQKVSGSGQLLWTAGGVLVCPVTVTPLFFYKLISDNKGGAIVLWDDTRSNGQVYGQHIDPDGNLLWPVNGLACTAPFTHLNTFRAVADSTGGVFITYTITTNLLYNNEVILQHVTADGSLHWGPMGEDLSVVAGDQLFPALTIDSLDNVIVTWQDHRLDPKFSEIWGQRVSAEKEIKWGLGGIMLVDSVVPQFVQLKIATDTSRGAVITWLDDFTNGETTAHLFGVRIDSTGSTIWEKAELATYTTAQLPGEYEMVPDLGGGAYISWISSANSLSAQHVLPNGSIEFALTGKPVSNGLLFLQNLGCDSNGVAVAVWTDVRSGASYDAYAARISAAVGLPVTWISFTGSLTGSAVLLHWQTVEEWNNKGFTIQRSINGTRYDSIGFVAASASYRYNFTDNDAGSGSNFYRLQQRDIDGKISYSRTIRIDMDKKPVVKIYPNPASHRITVSGVSAGNSIGIYGLDGKRYKEVKSTATIVEIDISDISAGMYMIRIVGINSKAYLLPVVKK